MTDNFEIGADADAGPAGGMTNRVHVQRRPIRAFCVGSGWFKEHAGGLERVYGALAKHLPHAGIDVRGMVVGSSHVAEDSLGRFQSFAQPDDSLFTRWWGARRTARAMTEHIKPDLLASHFALYGLPVLSSIRRVPLVVHFHGPWAWEVAEEVETSFGTHLKKQLETVVYRRATRCIVLSEAFRKVLAESYGVSENIIEVIPGGVEVGRFESSLTRAEAREILGWDRSRPTVVCVRRLAKRMGIENLIDAVDILRHKIPRIQLFLAGRGPLQDQIERRVREQGLENNVRILGFVTDEDLPIVYRAGDVSIVPTSALEGFGLVTLESLAAGTPVLVTPVGGLPEAVQSLSADLVLSGSGVQDIRTGLEEGLTGVRRLPGSEECLSYVRRNHDWPVIARRVAAVYREVCA